jgi:phospholipase C
MASPAWPRTLLVWTFDEGGGYYDHVPPPAATAPDDIPPLPPAPHYDGFARYGFRVPAVVVSPWSRPGHVTSVVHDHTSILAMVERKWNLRSLTRRDAAANDLSDFLDLSQPAFQKPPQLAEPLAGPAQIACETSGPGQIPPPGSVTRS